MTTCYQKINSPVGQLFIAADDKYLRAITFAQNEERLHDMFSTLKHENNAIITQTQIQLQEYFAGKRTQFDLPLHFSGTAFQKKAWHALLTIPYGETRSYSEQAQLIGKPKAARAVGTANALNPIAIVVPCHRVITKSGKLSGYGGGVDNMKFLLNLEGETTRP